MGDGTMDLTWRDRLYGAHERALSWIAWHLPRHVVYWIGVRLWTEATDMRERGFLDIAPSDLTCEEALRRFAGHGTKEEA